MESLSEAARNKICREIDNDLFVKVHDGSWSEGSLFGETEYKPTDVLPSVVLQSMKKCLKLEDGSFPGPMCCPFRKCHLNLVKERPYTLMEKSDGLRVLLYGCQAEKFPVWCRVQDGQEVVNSFEALLELEDARKKVNENGGAILVKINGKNHHLTFSQSDLHYHLAECGTESVIDCQRTIGQRLLLYGVERSMKAVYLFDSFFVAEGIRSFVADAELISCPGARSQCTLAFFDLYALYTIDSNSEMIAERSTSKRYASLVQLGKSISPSSIYENVLCNFYIKQLYELPKMGELLRKISHDAEKDIYLFDGPFGRTLNDGIVFTPEDFPCFGGSRAEQLKWKWTNSLSVDWKVYASPENAASGKYNVLLYLKRRGLRPELTVEGHWELSRPMPLENPFNFDIPTTKEEAVVVECKYDYRLKRFSMVRLRRDKTIANAIVTVISVFESIAEKCSLAKMTKELLPFEDLLGVVERLEPSAIAGPLSATASDQFERVYAPFALRVKSEGEKHTFTMTWCTNKTNLISAKNCIHVPLCPVYDCSGTGFPRASSKPNTLLHNLLMLKVGDAGGTAAWSDFIVRAYFDRKEGHWVIYQICEKNVKNFTCTFDNVLLHLSYVIATDDFESKHTFEKLPLNPPQIVDSETMTTSCHYGTKVDELATVKKSDRSALRRGNNLVKACQMTHTCSLLTNGRPRVAEFCCGRGGDLQKWAQNSVSFLWMTDASLDCVAEAAARYSVSKQMSTCQSEKKGFKAHFSVHDAFDYTNKTLLSEIQKFDSGKKFDIASCQFSIHYGCRSEENLDYFLRCVSSSLKTGGFFIGTTVNDRKVIDIYKEYGLELNSPSLHIRFPEVSAPALRKCAEDYNALDFGIAYSISIENCVTELTEYIVPWNKLCSLCIKHSLDIVYSSTFEQYATDYAEELANLIQEKGYKYTKRSRDGDVLSDFKTGPAGNLVNQFYIVFAFKKR